MLNANALYSDRELAANYSAVQWPNEHVMRYAVYLQVEV